MLTEGECRELEEWFGFKVVDAVLLDSGDDEAKKKKEKIRHSQLDQQRILAACAEKAPMIARECGWLKL